MVSVLVANHNYGRFLREALLSLKEQSYQTFEVVVCDDASTDESCDVAAHFVGEDERFKLIRHSVNRGQAAAFNSAFAGSRGEVLCFLDSDDTFAPGKLEAVVEVLRGGIDGLVVHPLSMVDERGRYIQRIPSFTKLQGGWLAPSLLRRGGRWRWVPTSGITMRREIANMIFPMPEHGYRSMADTYFLMLAPMLTSVGIDQGTLAQYRLHGANNFARTRLDREQIAHSIATFALSVDHVNARLRQLGRPASIRVDDNLEYRELLYQRDLLARAVTFAELLDHYRSVRQAISGDDLYGTLQKRWAAGMYLVALMLPRTLRADWLSLSISASRMKEFARKVWTRMQRSEIR